MSDLAVVAAVRLLVSAVVLASGFEGVSDDDFARVSLAQRWAADPAVDPTGTSWLPAPFWIYGSALALFGRSLLVARVLSVVLGVGSAWLVYAAARLLVRRREAAVLGAVAASLFPYGAYLGASPLPELPTAALTVFAVATLGTPRASLRMVGALALLVGCLSRYEPWIVSIGFAFVTLRDLLGGRLTAEPHPPGAAGRDRVTDAAVESDRAGAWGPVDGSPREQAAGSPRRADAIGWGAVLVALSGPALWMVHNQMAHGDALHFLRRVSAYKQALGQGASGISLADVLAYPLAVFQKEPELTLVAIVLPVALALVGRRWTLEPRSWRAIALALWLVVGLSLAASRGGAATHHPERALLAIWLMVAISVGAGAEELRWARRPSSTWVAGLVLVAAVAFGAVILRPWFAELDSFARRTAELEAGRLVAARVGPADRVLLDVQDYGYFAVLAGSGRPESFVLDRDPDPRKAPADTSFVDRSTLCARAEEEGARYALGAREPGSPFARSMPDPVERAWRWALWDLAPACARR